MANKDLVVQARLNKSLLDLAQEGANRRTGGNLSEYIRLLILEQNDKSNPVVQKELQKLRMEINRIGVNINQIAKNNNNGLYLEKDKKELYDNMDEILKLFQILLSRIN